jgi:four helix bundle protein
MTGPIRRFQDLEVYQEAVRLAAQVCRVVERLPARDYRFLADQMRRAAVSVVANIAEGYGKKRSVKDFRAYLDVAVGSCNEVVALFDVCDELEMLPANDSAALSEAYAVLAKRLTVLGENWR